jgi:hypothetical protein
MKYILYPEYKKISMHNLKPMTIILEAGSNWFTKTFENKCNKYPYKPPFTHALIHIKNGDCVNVGFTTTIKKIQDVIKKSHYYLAIELMNLNLIQIEEGQSIAYNKAGSAKSKFKFYDVLGFLSFGLRKLGLKIKGSEKFDFCSDQVVDIFSQMSEPLFKTMKSELTSPCDLYIKLKDYQHAKIKQIEVLV